MIGISIDCYVCYAISVIEISFQDIEQPDGQTNVNGMPKKCEKALLARIWGNFDKKLVIGHHNNTEYMNN